MWNTVLVSSFLVMQKCLEPNRYINLLILAYHRYISIVVYVAQYHQNKISILSEIIMQQIIEVPMKLTVSVRGSWCTGIDDKDLQIDIVNNTHMIMLCEYSGADVSQMSFVYFFFHLVAFSLFIQCNCSFLRIWLQTLSPPRYTRIFRVIYLRETRQKGSKQSKRCIWQIAFCFCRYHELVWSHKSCCENLISWQP